MARNNIPEYEVIDVELVYCSGDFFRTKKTTNLIKIINI